MVLVPPIWWNLFIPQDSIHSYSTTVLFPVKRGCYSIPKVGSSCAKTFWTICQPIVKTSNVSHLLKLKLKTTFICNMQVNCDSLATGIYFVIFLNIIIPVIFNCNFLFILPISYSLLIVLRNYIFEPSWVIHPSLFLFFTMDHNGNKSVLFFVPSIVCKHINMAVLPIYWNK